MSFINFRTAILCWACCLCTVSVNAQEIVVDLSTGASFTVSDSTGDLIDEAIGDDMDIFETTLNEDGISNSNVLIVSESEPFTFDVFEAPGTGLQITLVNATATTGIDTDFGVGSSINVSGIGIALAAGVPQRGPTNTDVRFAPFDDVPQSGSRLDSSHDEFLTFSFNQDVTVTAIALTNLTNGETFQFGPAENITNLSNMDLPDLTMGTFAPEGPQNPASSNNLMRFTFETPLQFAAGEEILIGETGNDPALQTGGTPGVGLEQIVLTIDGDGGLDDGHGDVNLDGIVNFLDIAPFINVLSSGGSPAEESQADCSGDGVVSFLDISPFIQALAAAAS